MSSWKDNLDHSSYAYGVASAFCECVAADCKRCGLSAPITPEEYENLVSGMEEIAKAHGLKIYYDENLDTEEKHRITWWAFYKHDFVINEYLALRNSGENPVTDIKPFNDVLSYGICYTEKEKGV